MTQAEIFTDFMIFTWEYGNKRHHDSATEVAEVLGGKPTNQNTGDGDEDTVEWLFPDGSIANIQRNGSGIH